MHLLLPPNGRPLGGAVTQLANGCRPASSAHVGGGSVSPCEHPSVADDAEQRASWRDSYQLVRDLLVQAIGTLLAASVAWMWAVALGYVSRPETRRILTIAVAGLPPVIMVGFFMLAMKLRSGPVSNTASIIITVASILALAVLAFIWFGIRN